MRKIDMIRRVDWILLPATIAMLASSVQLEATAGRCAVWVWGHICIGLFFFGLILWHLWLHFPIGVWTVRLWRSKAPDMRWMTALMLLTLISAIIATGGWIASPTHSIAGAIHGKSDLWLLPWRGGISYAESSSSAGMMCSDVDSIYVIG